MEIFRESLVEALQIAIATQERTEEELGYTSDSALVATWKIALQTLLDGGIVTIKESK